MDIVLRTTGLKKYYGAGETQVKALNGVDLEIERETFTAITGASGSGKTTLFNLIGGLDTPTEGSIEINGIRLSELAPPGRPSYWRMIRRAIWTASPASPSPACCVRPAASFIKPSS